MKVNHCRLCGAPLNHLFVDLGVSPLANSYVNAERMQQMEPMFPLRTHVCNECFLVQTEDYETPENIFSDYAYFSSFSESWLVHCKQYVDTMIERFSLNASHQIVEIASNDGYLLQYFLDKSIPVLGIEPAANVAEQAVAKGVSTIVDFFGVKLAQELRKNGNGADVLLGNNVLAHVPDINDFVAGMKILLQGDGVITMEFPHLMQLIQQNQFDTIYHEHYSYLSLSTVCKLFEKHKLEIFDVECLPTHGGSLRIYGKHKEDVTKPVSHRVHMLLKEEHQNGLLEVGTYSDFKEAAKHVKWQLTRFLVELKQQGKTIAGYGAPAKGNTLLNYCGIDSDYLDYTVDRSPHKQGKVLPGTRIAIHEPEYIRETRPDYLLILPWNLKDEIMTQTSFIREWGGKWIVPIPQVTVIA